VEVKSKMKNFSEVSKSKGSSKSIKMINTPSSIGKPPIVKSTKKAESLLLTALETNETATIEEETVQ